MNLNSIKRRIEAVMALEKRWPIIIDFQNRADLAEFVEYFSVGDNKILAAEKYCGKDGTFKLEELMNTIESNIGTTFVTGLTAFLKLQGESYTNSTLKTLLSKNVGGHLFLITYQCKEYLRFSDIRFAERNQILIADGDKDSEADICFITPALKTAFPYAYDGFEKIGEAVEHNAGTVIYIATDVDKNIFDRSIYNISRMSNGYDILCVKDARTKTISSTLGSAEQWNLVLKEMGNSDWVSVVENHFGPISNLSDNIARYYGYDDYSKWLFFTSLSLFGCNKNTYLQRAVYNAGDYKELTKSLYRTILTLQHTDSDFNQLYAERKELLKFFSDDISDVVDFCKVVAVKGEAAIHYLTDLSQPEKEKIIDWLDVYGNHYSSDDLCAVLHTVYPDLAEYLSVYRFKKPLLDIYFESYKYQKVVNRLQPTFEAIVDEQAQELSFVDALKSRASIVDRLNLQNAHAYFFDALGVEYLGYIQAKCQQYGLSASISFGRCELPSITEFNKEFLDTFKEKGCPVTDIKALDEIKHHGENSFDYEKSKKPLYLIKELEIIDELLKKIRASIYAGQYEKAVVISDHGASRLAVLHETENLWEMATNGVHSGRCCPKNEINSKPDFAVESENFWVLTNYDRFQGGRKANVEVHGGASLEEVTVPIIEISMITDKVEAFITEESKVVVLAAKEYPTIKIFVGTVSDNICIKIGGKFYDAKKTQEDYLYVIDLPEYTKKGVYTFEILNGTDSLSSNETFEIKKKGVTENSLFD